MQGTFNHTVLDDCTTENIVPNKTHWAVPLDQPPFYAYALKPGITFTYLGLKVEDDAAVRFNNKPSRNLFVAGEMMAGNVLGQGYTAGVGMSIGTTFGRIAGKMQPTMHFHKELNMNASTKALIPVVQLSDHEQEVQRALQICNACRYCESFCAVFAAMTKRLEFNQADIHYMANLCHNCGACLHACQYAPPHEFGVNIPKAMAQVRLETYQEFATPQPLGRLYKSVGIPFVSALTLIFFFAC